MSVAPTVIEGFWGPPPVWTGRWRSRGQCLVWRTAAMQRRRLSGRAGRVEVGIALLVHAVAFGEPERSPAAQPSSRAREPFSRPDPGAATPRPSKSAARWCAATASRRSPGTTEPTRSSATSMPIELGRRSTSSTNDGRRTPDALRPGPPRRLPAPTRRTPRRRRDPQTRSPRVRVSARRGCAVWRDHDDESAHHSTVCDTGALHRGDVGRPVPLRLPQRRGVAGERG